MAFAPVRARAAIVRRTLRERPAEPRGDAGAEGATAPETLRQKDRGGMTLWKAAARHRRGSPTE
jgi:hypothetical protein